MMYGLAALSHETGVAEPSRAPVCSEAHFRSEKRSHADTTSREILVFRRFE
jgi:hypothetical protein